MKKILFLTIALLCTIVHGAWAVTGITDVMLIGGNADEVNSVLPKYTGEGWTSINYDLNKGAGGDFVFLLYKTGESGHITSLYLKTGGDRADNITAGGHNYTIVPYDGSEYFKSIKGDLNSHTYGENINLYYTKDTEGFNAAHYLTSISFSNTPSGGLDADGDGIGHDLNKGAGGDFIFLYPSYGAAEGTLSVTTEAELQEAVRYSTATVQLGGDITLGSAMCVGGANTITLDLNGYTLQRNVTENSSYHMVIHNYGTLTVNDGSGDNSGKITGGRAYGGGGIYCEPGSALTFNGGTVTGNNVTTASGGGGFGGGILINNNVVATITGGLIVGNGAPFGGGIYNQGTLTLSNNALISGNTGNYGGGIYNTGTLNFIDGTITDNLANLSSGGGIWNSGTLNMKGKPIVSGNNSTANGIDNVYLNGSSVINVTGAFTEGAKIGVRPSSTSNAFTSGYSTYNSEIIPNSFFFSDAAFHKMSLNGSGEAILRGAEGNWIEHKSEEITHKDGNTWYIERPEDLAHVAYHVKAGSSNYYGITFILNTDLDMSAHFWTPIGTDDNHTFKGNFNGNGHTISGIYVDSTEDFGGLFGYVVGSALPSGSEQRGCDYIKNFVLKDSYIKGGDYTGGVVGFLRRSATLENVVCQADVTGGTDVGGIVGQVCSFNELHSIRYVTTIKNCLYLSGTVSATATGNRAAVIGNIVSYYNQVSLSNNYYIDPASYIGNDYDVRAYPITMSIPEGVTVNYTSSGVTYDGIRYAPEGSVNFTVNHDLNHIVTVVKANGDELVASEGIYSFNINPATTDSYAVSVTAATSPITGAGTEADPYLVKSQDDWNFIANYLNSGQAPNDFSGTYFKLDAENITINQRMGNASHPFCGIFDGDGKTLTLDFGDSEDYLDQECAPFYSLKNATIKNLVVSGNIYSSAQHNGSIAVTATGNKNHIQNCVSSVSIHSSIEGDCTNGGFIGILNIDGTHVFFEGCAFTGELVGTNATNWGGFVGWREYRGLIMCYVYFTDCLFAPTTINIKTEGGNSRTFCRSRDNTTGGAEYNNSYYTEVLQAADCGEGFSLTTAPANIGNEGTAYDVSGITHYANGLKYDGRYYMLPEAVSFANDADNSSSITAKNDWFVNVTLSYRTLYRDGDWNTLCLPFDVELEGSPLRGGEARTLSEASFSDGTLTLNFSDPVTTLTAGTPYIIKWNATDYADLVISSADAWNTFASAVNGGNDYSGKVVVLNADITVTDMVGTSSNKFRGTFNGNGHTLNFTKNTSEQYCAPFRYVENATIMNLHTTGTITTSKKFGTGLVGYTKGTTVINNCWSSVSIISSVSGDGSHGGFVGYTEENASNTMLTNCLFDGSITGANTHSCGGLIGWNYGIATLNNCVFRPTSITLANSDNATFSRGSNVTVTNCYYSQNLPGASGQGTAIGEMTDEALLAALGNEWMESNNKVVPGVTIVPDIINPVFNGVIINATEPTTIRPTDGDSDGKVSFIGIYNPETLPAGDASNLYLGAGNQLYWPNKARTLNAFRGYFNVNLGGDSQVRAFRLNFGEEVITGIIDVPGSGLNAQDGADDWFTLSGMRQSGKPSQKGIYIHGGKKVVVK